MDILNVFIVDDGQGMLGIKELDSSTIIKDKNSSLSWGIPSRAHDISAHTNQDPLTDIARQLLDYAFLSRAEMQQFLTKDCIGGTL
ncbi:hypothetical protein [Colwellia piezophila]|uniref:hypothetical protein n=1 Tax=Colwellia piezophila TaxID=211668 RepID=UPI00036C52C5|nr:hypothetical protein [Colwellia piezophila]